ncbi:hypothetical protein GIB67_040024 [Kingdonia uniflora]|uniref:Pentatricopeptide repeat-containing protein n=1 Tax=Kingdonia uniflora TaxID=39325 RepID=A0A7J7MUQ1_9MAGN|nr:hypothetical protein GIB67_040024 [Kingdonia uniflora]
MLALRRASNPIRGQLYHRGDFRSFYAKSGIPNACSDDVVGIHMPIQVIFGRCISSERFYFKTSVHQNFSLPRRGLSSQADSTSSPDETHLDGEFSDLGTPIPVDSTEEGNPGEKSEMESISELEPFDNDDFKENSLESSSPNKLELSDTETDTTGEDTLKKDNLFKFFKVVLAAGSRSVRIALDKWVEEGNLLDRNMISYTLAQLRRRSMLVKALQVTEWLEANKHIELVERDYSSHLSLIGKVYNLQIAEKYLDSIPKSFRGEVVYRTFLASCVAVGNLKKAEEVYNKMRDLDFPLSVFVCDQLLLLYRRLDKKKIADILLLMEKENLKPTAFTYRILIDIKGQSNDIAGMEQVVEAMEAEGFEPDTKTLTMVGKYYILGGLKEKAEAVLKKMEGGNLKENRWVCTSLPQMYASLGKIDDVKRVWEVCQSNPRLEEYAAVMEAYGLLGRIPDAEAIFEKMVETRKLLPSRCYSTLLEVYARYKLFAKGKDLAKRMVTSGCNIDVFSLNALVKLYIDAGEVEKADSILHKACENSKLRPMFWSYLTIMDRYADRGDIHNAEKIFQSLKQAGYEGPGRQYHTLLKAYVNAKTPAYGFRERMIVGKIFPNSVINAQLAQLENFKKKTTSSIFD